MKIIGMALVIVCLAIAVWPSQAKALTEVGELPDSILQMIVSDSTFIYISITDTPKTLSLVTIRARQLWSNWWPGNANVALFARQKRQVNPERQF